MMSSSDNGKKWNDIPRRLGTISIGIPILWMVWINDTLRTLFFHGLHFVIACEWVRMTNNNSIFPIISTILVMSNDSSLFASIFVASTALITLLRAETRSVMSFLQGVTLITIPFRVWLDLTASRNGFLPTISLLLTVWNCDTGALLVGRVFGRQITSIPIQVRIHLQRISPKKSIEGLLGGILFGTLTYLLLPKLWKFLINIGVSFGTTSSYIIIKKDKINFYKDVRVGLILSFLAILGDLYESAIKRQYQVKDTSKLLPGHGGILDRFDSSLIAVLIYHYYLQHFNPSRGY